MKIQLKSANLPMRVDSGSRTWFSLCVLRYRYYSDHRVAQGLKQKPRHRGRGLFFTGPGVRCS
jgi:hypothetical protein